MPKNLNELTAEVLEAFKKYELTGTKPWTAEIAAKDLSYQVGSLAKAMMQQSGERYPDGLSPEEIKRKVADELADILAEVLFIASKLDINLGEAWQRMLASDAVKVAARQNHA